LVLSYLFEKRKGSSSKFYNYIKALPECPPLVHTFSAKEREVLSFMSGEEDKYTSTRHIVDAMMACVRPGLLWGTKNIPTQPEMEIAFFLVLSRISYLRMIPVCDLANCAMPEQDNSKILPDQIVDGRRGCALVTKTPVKAGEELVIDYDVNDAVNMLINYGCTMGLENTHSVTKLRIGLPLWLEEFVHTRLSNGAQLREDEPTGLSNHALMLIRMAALGSLQDLDKAVASGFLQGIRTAEKCKVWLERQRKAYLEISALCRKERLQWEEKFSKRIASLGTNSLASSTAAIQYQTDKRLLFRCETKMRDLASASS